MLIHSKIKKVQINPLESKEIFFKEGGGECRIQGMSNKFISYVIGKLIFCKGGDDNGGFRRKS
jgi:hypothetical protein